MKFTYFSQKKVSGIAVLLMCASLLCLLFDSGISIGASASEVLELEEAYRLALKSHEQIMIAQAEVEKSKLFPSKANSIMMPRIDLEGIFRGYDDDIEWKPTIGNATLPPVTTIPKEQWIGRIGIEQPIYEGTYYFRRQQADLAIASTEDNYQSTVQEVLFQVAWAYYEVLKAKEQVQNYRDILSLTQEELRVAKVKLDGGQVTEDAVLKAELEITSTLSKLVEAENRFKLSKDYLRRLVGGQIGAYDVVAPPPPDKGIDDYQTLSAIAFENRHDYLSAQGQVTIAEMEVDVVKSKWLPRIDGTWDYIAVTDEEAFYQNPNYWIAQLRLTIPLYEKGTRIWELKEKKETLRQAELGLEDLDKGIRMEVEEALLNVMTLETVLKNLQKQVQLAQKSYDIVFSKFMSGAASSTDLHDALEALEEAKTQLTTATYDSQVSILNLRKEIGIFANEYLSEKDME
jgi:outer membrane protein